MTTDGIHTTLASSDDLLRHLDDPDWILFDCRFDLKEPAAGHALYLRGHIPGARYADLDKDLSSAVTPTSGRHPLPHTDELINKLRDWGVNQTSQVIVYDDVSGFIAGRMWWLLRYLGHTAVAVLDGGFEKWHREGLPLEAGEIAAATKGNFVGAANDAMWVKTESLERLLRDGDTAVIDARAPKRYSGEEESVDSEGGHIPGSINQPLQNNLDEHGCFRPADELREIYAKLHKPRTIHSCGSGVTACHNLLAMEIAGFPGLQLYVGSWSEWIRSPQRPRATGMEPG